MNQKPTKDNRIQKLRTKNHDPLEDYPTALILSFFYLYYDYD